MRRLPEGWQAARARPTATLRHERPWSWAQLVAECGGNEDAALHRLGELEGLGEYEDDVHRRAQLRGPRR